MSNPSPKIWLVFMAGPGALEDLQELITPILNEITGVVCTYHGDPSDPEAAYLATVKKEGKIICLPYSHRHFHSRNTYLWCGPIQQGDWCLQVDTMERIAVQFAERMRGLIAGNKEKVNMYNYYGKPLLFEFHESMEYRGTPHEGIIRQDGGGAAIELAEFFPEQDKSVRINVRNQKRLDPHQFVDHYAKYYISQPWGSNHCLLGNEKRGNAVELFKAREILRLKFKEHLRQLGVPLTVEGLKKYLTETPISEKMKEFINSERILNDFYRYHILKDMSVKDDHTWEGMIKI